MSNVTPKKVNVHVDFYSGGGFSCESSEDVYNFSVERSDSGGTRYFKVYDHASDITCASQDNTFLKIFKECPAGPFYLSAAGMAFVACGEDDSEKCQVPIPKETQVALVSILTCAAAEFSAAGDFDSFYEAMKIAAKLSVDDL